MIPAVDRYVLFTYQRSQKGSHKANPYSPIPLLPPPFSLLRCSYSLLPNAFSLITRHFPPSVLPSHDLLIPLTWLPSHFIRHHSSHNITTHFTLFTSHWTSLSTTLATLSTLKYSSSITLHQLLYTLYTKHSHTNTPHPNPSFNILTYRRSRVAQFDYIFNSSPLLHNCPVLHVVLIHGHEHSILPVVVGFVFIARVVHGANLVHASHRIRYACMNSSCDA